MRILLIITILANIAFAFGSLLWMPEKIAAHFGPDGNPTRFEPPIVSAVLMSFTVVFTGAILLGSSLMTSIIPPEHWNMPNRDYWLNDENRPQTIRRVCCSLELIGILTMLLILHLQWESFRANLIDPPKLSHCIYFGLGIYLAAITFETVRLCWSFRLPKEK